VAALERHKVQISMAAVGHAEENGYAERVIRTIQEEEVVTYTFKQHFRVQFYGAIALLT
jgi:hypothetical protein